MKKTGETMYCDKPDRDVPAMTCGYPIPCPFHTAIISLETGKVDVPPSTPDITVSKLKEIVKTLYESGSGTENVMLVPVDSPLLKAIESNEFDKLENDVHTWMCDKLDPISEDEQE